VLGEQLVVTPAPGYVGAEAPLGASRESALLEPIWTMQRVEDECVATSSTPTTVWALSGGAAWSLAREPIEDAVRRALSGGAVGPGWVQLQQSHNVIVTTDTAVFGAPGAAPLVRAIAAAQAGELLVGRPAVPSATPTPVWYVVVGAGWRAAVALESPTR